MKLYEQAIEEVVSGSARLRYGSSGSGFEYPAATMIAYIYEIDINIVFGDIKTAKNEIEKAKKEARKVASRAGNEERRLANLSRRHNDEANRSTD